MTPEFEIDEAMLTHYVAGECTPAERGAVDWWVTASREHGERLAHLKMMWAAAKLLPMPAPDVEAMSKTVLDFVDRGDRKQKTGPARISNGFWRSNFGKGSPRPVVAGFAAAVVMALVVIVTMMQQRESATVASLSAHTFTTVRGQYATVALGNGATALLGPATTLTVSASSRAATTLTVTGQAFFTVAPHPQTSFVVNSGNAVVRVLGTSFTVRRYPTDRTMSVVVTAGRVSLQSLQSLQSLPRSTRSVSGATRAVLSSRMLGVVDDSGQIRVTPNVAVDDYTGWTTGKLVFNKTSVGDIVTELSRAYGVTIRVADSTLATKTMTWTVPVASRSLSGVLEVLSATLHAHQVRSADVITLVPGSSASQEKSLRPSAFTMERQYGR
jgi:transmembrane sensor